MTTHTVSPSRAVAEARRLRAFDLDQQGWKQCDIADALGVTEGAVSQWLSRARKEGRDSLRAPPIPGRPRTLSPDELARLPDFLLRGAEAYGFRGQVWTLARVAAVIKAEFGVSYHPDHCSRLLKEIGWSCQKPIRRATQRDEQAIEEWKRVKYPAIKKGRS
jgi:transposase